MRIWHVSAKRFTSHRTVANNPWYVEILAFDPYARPQTCFLVRVNDSLKLNVTKIG